MDKPSNSSTTIFTTIFLTFILFNRPFLLIAETMENHSNYTYSSWINASFMLLLVCAPLLIIQIIAGMLTKKYFPNKFHLSVHIITFIILLFFHMAWYVSTYHPENIMNASTHNNTLMRTYNNQSQRTELYNKSVNEAVVVYKVSTNNEFISILKSADNNYYIEYEGEIGKTIFKANYVEKQENASVGETEANYFEDYHKKPIAIITEPEELIIYENLSAIGDGNGNIYEIPDLFVLSEPAKIDELNRLSQREREFKSILYEAMMIDLEKNLIALTNKEYPSDSVIQAMYNRYTPIIGLIMPLRSYNISIDEEFKLHINSYSNEFITNGLYTYPSNKIFADISFVATSYNEEFELFSSSEIDEETLTIEIKDNLNYLLEKIDAIDKLGYIEVYITGYSQSNYNHLQVSNSVFVPISSILE